MRDVIRLVVGSGVIEDALLSRGGSAHAVVIAGLRHRFVWCCSVPLFYEYRDVLSRPGLLLDAGIRRREAEAFLTDLASVLAPVDLHVLWRPRLRDVGDEVVLATAVHARASAIVTQRLLAFDGVTGRFGVGVWTPAEVRGMMGP